MGIPLQQAGPDFSLGVLLCWLASVTVLPCLLAIFPLPVESPRASRWAHWERLWRARPGIVLGVALAITALAAGFVHRPRFDYNLLHMMPTEAAAIRFDGEFHLRCRMCSLYAVSLASSESEMRSRVERFSHLPTVARVESPANWLPAHPEARRPQVERILHALPEAMKKPPARLSTSQLLEMRDRYQGKGQLSEVLQGLGPGPIQDGLSYFFNQLHDDLEGRTHWLRQQRAEPLPRWDQIPPDMMGRYRSGSDWLIKIYPREDVWEKEPLQRFLADLSQVDSGVTGLPVLTYTYLDQLRSSYWVAGRNALGAIFMILLLSFGRLDRALWALSPKLLGVVWMLGAMGILGIHFNPANATALPLTLGIGLVFGVHVVHHLSESQGEGIFAGSTGQAVVVSGVSTVLGYLSLISSPYRGIASLGWVMGLGIVSSLVTSLVVLPVVLQALGRTKPPP